MSTFVNRDGSTEAWDRGNYIPLGSMRDDPSIRTFETFPPPPSLYIVVEEYPAFTIDEFIKLAKDQRQQRARKLRFRKLLRKAADLAARRGFGGPS